jgi:hypothetical protein
MKTKLFGSLTVILGCLLLSLAASAQTATTGSLTGKVADPTGAVIMGAVVTVTNPSTGEVRSATTSNDGNYTVSLLSPGSYTVEAESAGFSKAIRNEIKITVTETTVLPIQLALGMTHEEVTVSAQAEMLQTRESSLGGVVDSRQVSGLPLVSRNFAQIVNLSAGVLAPVTNAAQLGRGSESNVSGTSGQTVNGQPNTNNNYQMNGVPVNDTHGNGATGGAATPNPDTILEFKVQTSQYDASFGRNAGAQVNIVTKSGTNTLHGTLFEFFRNETLNANDFFLNSAEQPRAVLRQNQYGFTIGGPIVNNRLFFFGAYQGTNQRNGLVPSRCSASVYGPLLTDDRSAAALGGLFGGQKGALGGVAVASDGSNIDPIALTIMQYKMPNGQYLLPTPQMVVGVLGFSSYSMPCSYDENQIMGNIDYRQSQNSTFAARFFWQNAASVRTFNGGGNVPGLDYNSPEKFRVGSFSHTYLFSPTAINEASYGINTIVSNGDVNSLISWNKLGVPTPSVGADSFGVTISGSYSVGNGDGQIINQLNHNFMDTFSLVRSNHSIKLGGGITRQHLNPGGIRVPNSLTFLSFPDFLLGLPAGPEAAGGNGTQFSNVSSTRAFVSKSDRRYRGWHGSLYAQDTWQVSKTLTLNLGFRYERIGALYDELGLLSGIDLSQLDPNPPSAGTLQGIFVVSNFPEADLPLPAGVTQIPSKLNVAGDGQNTFAPRIGVAWRQREEAVLRAGYGIFYNTNNSTQLFTASNVQPWSQMAGRSGVANAPSSWEDPFKGMIMSPDELPKFMPY